MSASDRYLDSVSNLPAAPAATVELLSLFKDPDRDLDQIVRVITRDPSLTAEILRRCNSAFFAVEQPVENITEALTRLGFYEVYCTVVAVLARSATSLPGAQEGIDVEQLWQHLVTTAIAASELAEAIGEAKEVAFTSGLLHDIGKLVLASGERLSYFRLQQDSSGFGTTLLQSEEAAFGVNHANLGGCLLARWKLPLNISTAVFFHHDFQTAHFSERLAAIVRLADLLAHQIADCNPDAVSGEPSYLPTLQSLNLGPQDISSIVAKTEIALERAEGLILAA
jgi:putative nucleotidyltransferase with HDIG domain